MVECFPSMCSALDSIPSTSKKYCFDKNMEGNENSLTTGRSVKLHKLFGRLAFEEIYPKEIKKFING